MSLSTEMPTAGDNRRLPLPLQSFVTHYREPNARCKDSRAKETFRKQSAVYSFLETNFDCCNDFVTWWE
jgi:hypothetical protein